MCKDVWASNVLSSADKARVIKLALPSGAFILETSIDTENPASTYRHRLCRQIISGEHGLDGSGV